MHEAIKHEDPCAKRLANVVRQVQTSGGLWTECIAQLSPEQQAAIQELLNSAWRALTTTCQKTNSK